MTKSNCWDVSVHVKRVDMSNMPSSGAFWLAGHRLSPLNGAEPATDTRN